MASRAPVAASPAPARAADPGSANRAAKTGAPRSAATAPARGASSGIVDVSSSLFEPSQAIADEIEKAGPRGLDVRVIAKGLTEEGLIKVRQDRGKKYDSIGQGTMPLLNPWTQQLGGMHLNFGIDNSAIKNGFASFKPRAGGRNDWLQALKKNSALLGGLGLKIESLPTPVNKFEQGKLVLGVSGVKVVVGGYVDAAFDLLLENMEAPKVKGSADIDIRGAAKGKLEFDNPGNVLRGSVSLAVNFSSFNGAVKVAYLSDGTVDISGSAAYNANKLSGEIQFVATDLDTANKFAKDAIAAAGGKDNVQNAGPPSPVPVAKEGQKKRALAATGRLSFNLTTWFAGSVNVVVDGKGLVTVIGKIAPPGEIILFSERAWNKEIVKFEAKAYYGIPVVGNLNLFANISLSAIAKLGPARLYAIEILGTYSTDPEIQKNIQISGSINISAYGGLRLRAEGGAGIEILSHDLKFGIGLNADVGVKAYADARPTIGYRDPGVFYVSGTLDLVAQPMLGLGGEFFIELDAPWFSPLSDDRWSWPLFSKEWPLGEPLGMSATVKDYVLGSGKVPEIEMKPPEFDPSKFMTTMVDDKLPGKSGGKGDGRGTFKEDGSVPKPVVKPKLPPPKSASGKPSKKGSKPGTGKSAKPDSKAANDAKSTAILQKAAKPLTAAKGKGPFARGSLDQELGKIRRQVSGIDFGVRANGAKWVVTPKAGRMTGKGLEIGAKPEAEVDWSKEKQVFTNKAGENHTLRFIGTGPGAKLGIQSELMTIETYLEAFVDKDSADWKAARSVLDREKRVIFTPLAKDATEEKRLQDIKQALAKVSAAFAKLAGTDDQPAPKDYPKTTAPTPGPNATVQYIVGTPSGGTKPGKGPDTGTPGWKAVHKAGLTGPPQRWVQMHIISEKLGGKGVPGNLIPAPGAINSGPFRSFELSTLQLAQAKSGKIKNVVWVKVDVAMTGDYAKRITGQSGLYLWKGKKKGGDGWLKNEKYSFFSGASIPYPELVPKDRKISLNYSSGTGLGKITRDQKLIDIIKAGRIYPTLDVFIRRVSDRAAAAGVLNHADKVARIVAKVGSEVELHGPKDAP